MPNFRVTFKGDLGNLAQFDAAVKNSARGMEQAITSAHLNIGSTIGKIGLNKLGVGLTTKNQRSEIDAFNNTLIHSGEVIRRYVSGYKVQFDKMSKKFKVVPQISESYEAGYKQARGNVEQLTKALEAAAPVYKQLEKAEKDYATKSAKLQNKKLGLENSLNEARARLEPQNRVNIPLLALADKELRDQERELVNSQAAYDRRRTRANANALAAQQAAVAKAKQAVDVEEAPFKANIQNIEDALNRLGQTEKKYAADHAAAVRKIKANRLNAGLLRDVTAAENATPPINKNLATVLRESAQLREKLIKSGLGAGTVYGTDSFQKALAQQEASVSNYTRNLRTGVRTIVGEFKNLKTGVLEQFTVDLDDQGKVIGRWGGQLSGAGNILRQTVRDFQKVIEWTVATTVVFGSLALAAGQLKNINELNGFLTRFSITAQTSAEDTQAVFKDLAQVAYDTATPLNNLIKVADDIALATKEAGQSTEEWRADIVELTTAVGIFTNLTGTETVEAADQLSAAFKQMGIAPQELIGVLSKVTAVSGGQANAIADIVKALSTVSEAARAAGLSIDEQIASVQVLSQVTNKSAADVATAFKNLFGSISSVGSEKILSQFGINVRKTNGEIRDFLDIYRDIKKAVDSGVITQGRLPDVLRGISGGPRRAPDAAALLSNLGRIDEVVQSSAQATNEALIAQAKVLDTNQAKIIQFQNSIDTVIFEKFGTAVSELTNVLITFGQIFANVFNGLNPELVNLAIKLGLVVTGIKVFGSLIKLAFKGTTLTGIATGLRGIATQLRDIGKYGQTAGFVMEGDNGTVFGPAPPPLVGRGRLANILKRNKFGLAVGAAGAVGTAAALGGGVDTNTIGTALQVGGSVAALLPGLQAVGIAAIVAGTAIQLLAGNSQKAEKDTHDLTTQIYDLTQKLKGQRAEADSFQEKQKESLATIKSLNVAGATTKDQQTQLAAATSEYANATLDLAKANQLANQTFAEMEPLLQKLGGGYRELIKSVKAGGVKGGPEIEALSARLAKDILRATGQDLYAGKTIPVPKTTTLGSGSTDTTFKTGSQSFDLSELLDNPDKLLDVINARGGGFKGTFDVNPISVGYIREAFPELMKRVESGAVSLDDTQIDNLINAISGLTELISTPAANNQALTQLGATIQARGALGIYNSEELQQSTTNLNLAQALADAQAQAPRSILKDSRDEVSNLFTHSQEIISQFYDLADKGASASLEDLEEIAKVILSLSPQYGELALGGPQAINEGIVKVLKDAGVEQEVLDQFAQKYNLTLQTQLDLLGQIDSIRESGYKTAREEYGQRSANILIAENSGQFEGNAQGLADLKDQNKQAYDSSVQLINSIAELSSGSFVDLSNALSEVIGLQGLYISNSDVTALQASENAEGVNALQELQGQLASKLIAAALAAGVDAEGIRQLTEKIFELAAATAAIPSYKKVIIEYETRGDGVADRRLLNALDKEKKSKKEISDIEKAINDILKGGKGSNFGNSAAVKAAKKAAAGGGGGSSYNKPGLLDIPDEILAQTNYRDIVNQAVQNAKKLQGQVPGETKANRKEIVEILNGTKKVLESRGVGEEYLRRAMDELAAQIKKQNDLLSKADSIRRIRIGAGSFAAIANVPVNSISGVSAAGANGPVNITMNLNGTVLTPAQLGQFADQIAASLKRQLSG